MRVLVNNLLRKSWGATRWMRDVRSFDPGTCTTRRAGPTTVQIQTIDHCNAACIMCPYSSTAKTGPSHSMDSGLYRRILEELRLAGTVRSIVLMLQNEPLLDRAFPDRVRIAKQSFDRPVRISTVTNGAPLTAAVIDNLASSGIDRVTVSIDAVNEDTFNKIRQGLDFKRVVRNTHSLVQRLGPRRVTVRFLRQRENEGEEGEFAAYWRRHGVQAIYTNLTNRAGLLQSYEAVRQQRPDSWQRLAYPVLNRLVPACPYPFTSLSVLWDGRVIACCNDWGPRETLGDLSTQRLEQVWNGVRINHHRQLLRAHRAEESSVCAGCSQVDRYWRF